VGGKPVYAPPESGRWWPTATRQIAGDQIRVGEAGAWLYMACPTGPISDARTPENGLRFGAAIEAGLRRAATLTRVPPGPLARRRLLRSRYRAVHILLVNTLARFDPAGVAAETELRQGFHDLLIPVHLLTLGVKLNQDLVGGPARLTDQVRRAVALLLGQTDSGEPYRVDANRVRPLMSGAGMSTLSRRDLQIMDAWWSGGMHPDVHVLPHPNHLHLYPDYATGHKAEQLDADCAAWPGPWQGDLISWATVEHMPAGVVHGGDPNAWWGRRLIDAGAVCVSIKGLLEPAAVTRREASVQLREAQQDLDRREARSELPEDEKRQLVDDLDMARSAMSADQDPPPQLIETSIEVGFAGRDGEGGFDLEKISEMTGLVLNPMEHRQRAAWWEAMPASKTVASPWLHEVNVPMVAYAGLGDLAVLGDRPSATSVMVGLTEKDRQPVWLDWTALYRGAESSAAMALVSGAQGSGKTVLLQSIYWQASKSRNDMGEWTPIIIADWKLASDLSDTVSMCPAHRIVSLDDLLATQGVFDPLAAGATPTAGVSQAASYLLAVNPRSNQVSLSDYASDVSNAIMWGAQRGARFTGAAIAMAAQAGVPNADKVYQLVSIQAAGSPMFTAFCGMDPDGEPLRAAEGVTYIKVGDSGFDVMGLRGLSMDQMEIPDRVQVVLIRAFINSAINALAKRQGLLLCDEAWAAFMAGPAQIGMMNRIIRELGVAAVFASQYVRDALEAKLAPPAWQIILADTDPAEAALALQLAKLEATPARLARITAGARLPGRAPNWGSLRTLTDESGNILRPPVGLVKAPDMEAIYTTIRLPDTFQAKAATNQDARAARRQLEVEGV